MFIVSWDPGRGLSGILAATKLTPPLLPQPYSAIRFPIFNLTVACAWVRNVCIIFSVDILFCSFSNVSYCVFAVLLPPLVKFCRKFGSCNSSETQAFEVPKPPRPGPFSPAPFHAQMLHTPLAAA